jgi:hypothetical protein
VAEEYYSFDKALEELKLRSEELKRLVSQGEIPAIREKDSMRFRAADVKKLARNRVVEEELEFDEDLTDIDEGMVTAELSDDDTLLAADLEEEEEELTAVGSGSSRRAVAAAPVQRSVSRTQQLREKPAVAQEGTGFLVAVVASAVLMIYGLFVTQSIAAGQVTGMTQWLVDFFQK